MLEQLNWLYRVLLIDFKQMSSEITFGTLFSRISQGGPEIGHMGHSTKKGTKGNL